MRLFNAVSFASPNWIVSAVGSRSIETGNYHRWVFLSRRWFNRNFSPGAFIPISQIGSFFDEYVIPGKYHCASCSAVVVSVCSDSLCVTRDRHWSRWNRTGKPGFTDHDGYYMRGKVIGYIAQFWDIGKEASGVEMHYRELISVRFRVPSGWWSGCKYRGVWV